MNLVIDANVFMSALIASEGKTFDLIFNDRIRLFSVEYLLSELEEHKEEILAKSKLSEKDFNLVLLLISSRIEFVPYSEFEKYILEAQKITPDQDDREYFALALKLNCSIWSNDSKLKNQKIIKVYSTSEIIKLLYEEE